MAQNYRSKYELRMLNEKHSIVINVSQIVNIFDKDAIFVNELKQIRAKSKTFHKLNN